MHEPECVIDRAAGYVDAMFCLGVFGAGVTQNSTPSLASSGLSESIPSHRQSFRNRENAYQLRNSVVALFYCVGIGGHPVCVCHEDTSCQCSGMW